MYVYKYIGLTRVNPITDMVYIKIKKHLGTVKHDKRPLQMFIGLLIPPKVQPLSRRNVDKLKRRGEWRLRDTRDEQVRVNYLSIYLSNYII